MEEHHRTQFGLTVGVFAIIGLGIGITGYLGFSYAQSQIISGFETQFADAFSMNDESGLIEVFDPSGPAETLEQMIFGLLFVQAVLLSLFIGPTIAGLTGLFVGQLSNEPMSAGAVGASGAFVGFCLMALIVIGFIWLALDVELGAISEDGGGPLLRLLFIAGLPTAFVGGTCCLLGTVFDPVVSKGERG